MNKPKMLSLVVTSLFLATLWGCGSNMDSDSSTTPTVPIEEAASVGNCTLCHTLDVHTKFSPLVGQNPDTTLGFGSAISHDCEACHGGGQYHRGEGPIPFPQPTVTRCVTCHTQAEKIVANNKHMVDGVANCSGCHEPLALKTKAISAACVDCHTAETPDIVTKINASMHNFGSARFSASCQRCHTTEGFLNLLANEINPSDDVNYTSVALTLTAANAPTCAACHDPHTGKLRAVPGWDPNQNNVADEFDTCTACHNYNDNNGVLMAGSTSVSNTYHHEDSWYRLIPTTHYDNPETGVTAVPADNILEGYVIRQNSPNPCFDCHSHDLRTNTRRHLEAPTSPDRGETVFTEWAQSGHAGAILTSKEAAVANAALVVGSTSQDLVDAAMLAGSNGAEYAWNHYPWSNTSTRGDCQKCHTSTGYVNKIADGAAYDYKNNDFSHLKGWTATTGSGQAELLYCWGCHSNVETGEVRATGETTLDYTYKSAAIMISDLGSSNACILCHAGRGNVADAAKPTRDGSVYHHAVAAATLFSSETHVGYEFDIDGDLATDNYANVSYFAHNTIGVATGEGPCVACHMDAANHKFEVVEKDASDVITGINATVCYSCHDGAHGPALVATDIVPGDGTAAAAAAFLETESEGYQEAGAILVALATNNITNYLNYSLVAKWDHDSNGTTATVYRFTTAPVEAYGAWQNSKLASDEPGAFAHNRVYAKRLIFDSIDWLEDGAINGSIGDYSVTYPEGAIWLGTTRP